MILIPAIDLHAGRCVRLQRGRFDDVTDYGVEPDALLERYSELGASWVHIVDLDGAQDGRAGNREIVFRLAAKPGIQIQTGGGLRDATSIEALLSNGIARVVLGTLAVANRPLTRSCIERHGSEPIALALDVRNGSDGEPLVTTHGWARDSSYSLWDMVEAYLDGGLRHVLCTDVDRDGMLAGPNLALYREAVRRYPLVTWQASGGIRDARDLHALQDTGVAAAVCGRALLERRFLPEELEPFLPSA